MSVLFFLYSLNKYEICQYLHVDRRPWSSRLLACAWFVNRWLLQIWADEFYIKHVGDWLTYHMIDLHGSQLLAHIESSDVTKSYICCYQRIGENKYINSESNIFPKQLVKTATMSGCNVNCTICGILKIMLTWMIELIK